MGATFVPSKTTDLADISATAPVNAQVLTWVSSTSKWTPSAVSAAVSSVFGRTGAVVAQAGDYTAAQVGAQPSNATLTSLAAASYPSGQVLYGAGTGVPTTSRDLTLATATNAATLTVGYVNPLVGGDYEIGTISLINNPNTSSTILIAGDALGNVSFKFQGSYVSFLAAGIGQDATGSDYQNFYTGYTARVHCLFGGEIGLHAGRISDGAAALGTERVVAYIPMYVVPGAASRVPLGIQATSGQTAALTTWYDSTATPIGWIRPDASLKLPSLADTAAANDSAYYSSTQSTLAYKDSSGVAWPLTAVDTAPSDLYVATTGSDTTGTGASGAPYATVAKALSRLPDVLRADHTIHVADGTYAAGIDLRRFISRGDRTLTLVGNTTTPANVVFTGTITAPDSTTCALYVAGPVRVLVQGVETNIAATYGVFVDRNAILTLDRCTITAPNSNDISDTAVLVTNRSSVEFRGNVTLSNWALNGIGAYTYSLVTYTVAGTLTISRPDSFGAGIHLAYHAAMICQTTGTNISISGAKIGWQLGLHGEFQHIGGSSTLSASNGSTPSGSSGILCTDLSTWSTNQPLSLTHFTTGRESNSISYIEATGGITLSSVTTASSATQNSVNNP